MIWSDLVSIIEKNSTFLISSHVNPDGDSICSQLSLYWYINSLGKTAVIYNHDPVPAKFKFLKNSDIITTIKPQNTFDVFIILDASNPSRLGWEGHEKIASSIINIDHHRDNSKVGNVNIVNHTASATSEILYNFFTDMSIVYPLYVVEALYAGILTDTGGFQFSNTNSNVLNICANLAQKGANCSDIYRNIFTSFSLAGLILRAKIWSTLTFYNNKTICSLEMSQSLLEESDANSGDIEGMSDQALTASGLEVGIFIKYAKSYTHFSLRSSGKIDVGKIAQSIPGGGGHTCAAGCTINIPLEQAKKKLIEIITKELG